MKTMLTKNGFKVKTAILGLGRMEIENTLGRDRDPKTKRTGWKVRLMITQATTLSFSAKAKKTSKNSIMPLKISESKIPRSMELRVTSLSIS
jgi:hypothetical protein